MVLERLRLDYSLHYTFLFSFEAAPDKATKAYWVSDDNDFLHVHWSDLHVEKHTGELKKQQL